MRSPCNVSYRWRRCSWFGQNMPRSPAQSEVRWRGSRLRYLKSMGSHLFAVMVAIRATWHSRAEQSCQQTEPVNWRIRRIWRRNALDGRLNTVRRRVAPHSEENGKNRNTCQMFGISVRFRGDVMLSTKPAFKFEVEGVAPQVGLEPTTLRLTAERAYSRPATTRRRGVHL